jgi:hypothetical protein
MSIALASNSILEFLKGSTALETDNAAAVTAVDMAFGSTQTSVSIMISYGQMVSGAFVPGTLAAPTIVTVNLTSGAVTDQNGHLLGTLTGSSLTAFVDTLIGWRNTAESWLASVDLVLGTYTAWPTS